MRVLAVADAGNRTGFERVARNILSYLHETGEYDVTQMGVLYRGQPGIKYPYPVYPLGSDQDPMGIGDIQEAIKTHKPDVFWVFHDLWHVSKYASLKPINLPMAVYYPIDTPNLKWQWGMGLGAASALATYTTFAANETAASVQDGIDLLNEGMQGQSEEAYEEQRGWFLMPHPVTGSRLPARLDRLARYQNPESYHVVPHGRPDEVFRPGDQRAARRRFNIPQDAFVVLNVNTNQFRKRQDLTIRAFAEFAKDHPNAVLVLHCAGPTTQGWDLEQLVRYHCVQGRVRLIHQEEMELSEEDLALLYASADVQINTAGGEGWGLGSFEGAACGIPQLVPDWSATRELWDGAGVLLPISDYRAEPRYLNTMHAVVSVQGAVDALRELAESQGRRQSLADSCFTRAQKLWSWEFVGHKMGQVIRAAVDEPAMTTMSVREILATRKRSVQSTLRDRLVW